MAKLRHKTGAIASPRHKLAGTEPFRALRAYPPEWGVVAPEYSAWGNDRYGICVTSEEAANVAQYTAARKLTPVCLPEADVIAWARKHRFLNGAVITAVMDELQPEERDGLYDAKSKYYVGPYLAVDWENRADLCAAIYAGTSVKIGIASKGLGNAVQGRNGWMVLSASKNRSIDHCVSLVGYGSLQYLCGLCGVPVPSTGVPALFCYLMFTWGTVGIVSEQAMRAMTGEAWVRHPASIADPPYPPEPGPGPGPGPGPLPPLPPIPPPLPPPLPPGPQPTPPTPDPCPWLLPLAKTLETLARAINKGMRP